MSATVNRMAAVEKFSVTISAHMIMVRMLQILNGSACPPFVAVTICFVPLRVVTCSLFCVIDYTAANDMIKAPLAISDG